MRLPLNIGTLPGVPVKSYILIFNEEWPHFWMLEALSHAKKVFLPLDQDTWEGKFYKHLGIAWLCNVQGSIWYNHILQYLFLTPNFCKIHSTFFFIFWCIIIKFFYHSDYSNEIARCRLLSTLLPRYYLHLGPKYQTLWEYTSY